MRSSGHQAELERQRQLIKELEDEIERLRAELQRKSRDMSLHSAGIQKQDSQMERLQRELDQLKGQPQILNRPGTGSLEADKLRQERDQLIEENKKLKALLNEESAGPSSGNIKYLKNKVLTLNPLTLNARSSIWRRHWLSWRKRDQS